MQQLAKQAGEGELAANGPDGWRCCVWPVWGVGAAKFGKTGRIWFCEIWVTGGGLVGYAVRDATAAQGMLVDVPRTDENGCPTTASIQNLTTDRPKNLK